MFKSKPRPAIVRTCDVRIFFPFYLLKLYRVDAELPFKFPVRRIFFPRKHNFKIRNSVESFN